jgi:mono/diheme cytochrome c family protein
MPASRPWYRSLALIPVALFVISAPPAVTVAVGGEDQPAAPAKLDGKELFKTHCKSCHGAKAEAGEYTPMSLIQEQWDELFAGPWAETHGAIAAPGGEGRKLTDVIDAGMLEAIRKFCVDHAADSEQPMTCG